MRAKRTDKNQAEIVEHLRAVGVQTIVTNMGNDFPDLLCGASCWNGWTLLEVKQPSGCLDRGQLEFLRDATGAVAVVTDVDEATFAVLSGDGLLGESDREQIAKWLIRNPDQETVSVKKFRKLINGTN